MKIQNIKFNSKKLLFIFMGWFGIVAITAASPVTHKNQLDWEIFTHRDDIQALLVAGQSLWVGTQGGLEQYDTITGQQVQVLTSTTGLPDNHIKTLVNDNQGGLWIGTSRGGLVYRHANGHLDRFNQENSDLPSNHITALLYDNTHGLWVGVSYRGLALRQKNGSWKIFSEDNSELPSNNIKRLVADNRGGLWIGTQDKGLAYRHANGRWTVFDPNRSNLPEKNINALVVDKQGQLWVGTQHKGLAVYSPRKNQWTLFNQKNSKLPSNHIQSILLDPQGRLWVNTRSWFSDSLVYRHKGRWKIFDFSNTKSPVKQIHFLQSDGKGGLWIAGQYQSQTQLAHYQARGQWQILKRQESGLLDNHVSALLADRQGGLWVGSRSGLIHRQPNGVWEKVNHRKIRYISALLDDGQGGLWASGVNSLFHRRVDGKWTIFDQKHLGLATLRSIHTLAMDNRQGLWVGTLENGLFHRNYRGIWSVFNRENSGLPHNKVFSISFDEQGDLWVGTAGGLAHRRADGTWQTVGSRSRGRLIKTNGTWDKNQSELLPHRHVLSLLSGSGDELWVGTGAGLAHRQTNQAWEFFIGVRQQIGGVSKERLAHLHTDGTWKTHSQMPSLSGIFSLLPNGNNGLWVGTNEGHLAHLDTSSGTWAIFNQDNSALPPYKIQALVNEASGLWIGTNGGGLVHVSSR